MKKVLLLILILISGFAYAQEPESLTHNTQSYVNDFGNVFTEEQQQELDGMMRSFHNTVQITMVTVPTLGGIPRAEYATRLGNAWGVGSHADNGLLILICVPERQFFAAPGSGIQGELTDMSCSRYYDEIAKPQFKKGNYFEGSRDVLAKYIEILTPAKVEYEQKQQTEEVAYNKKQVNDTLSGIGYFLFAALVFVLIFLGIRRSVKQKEEKERQALLKKEEEAREFKKTKDKYYNCQQEIIKLNKTLETTIFKEDVDRIRTAIQGLTPKPFISDPEKWDMEDYIDKYTNAIKGVKPMIDEINRKSTIMDNCKKTLFNDKGFSEKNKAEIERYSQSIANLKFTIGDKSQIENLRKHSASVDNLIQELEKAHSSINTQQISSITSDIDKSKSSYVAVLRQLDQIIQNDNDKIKIAKSGKDALIKQVERYSSYIGKNGVSFATNNTTNTNCDNMLKEIHSRFTGNVITDYVVYNELVKQVVICNSAEKEYEAEQDRLRRIREEEERKRREEENRLRRIREEEERRVREEENRLRRIREEEEYRIRRQQEEYESQQRAARQAEEDSRRSNDSNSSSFGGGSFNGGGGGGEW